MAVGFWGGPVGGLVGVGLLESVAAGLLVTSPIPTPATVGLSVITGALVGLLVTPAIACPTCVGFALGSPVGLRVVGHTAP